MRSWPVSKTVVAQALALAVVAWLVAAGCGAGDAGTAGDAESSGGAVEAGGAVEHRSIAVELVARRRADDARDTIPLFRTYDLIGWRDTLVVIDGGNDRLVMFDTALSVIRVMGRSGAGPDEMERPFSITQWPGGVVVGDQGNTRFALYGRDGTFRTTLATPRVPMSIAADSRGDLYLPMYLPDTYLLRLDGAGRLAPFGARPGEPRPEPSEKSPPVTLDLVAVTAGDTVHVLDNQRGLLFKYAPDGRLVLERPLPAVPPAAVAERAQHAQERVGALMISGFAKRMVATADGRLLVLVKADGIWALLLDPADYGGTALRLPDAQPARTLLRSATAAYWAPPSIFVLTEDDLIRFRITDASPP